MKISYFIKLMGILIIVVFMISVSPIVAQEDNLSPRLSDDIMLFEFPTSAIGIKVSPDGNYISAIISTRRGNSIPYSNEQISLEWQMWNMQDLEWDGIQIAPDANFQRNLPNVELGYSPRFNADSDYMAWLVDRNILEIYTFPEIELFQTIPFETDASLWSLIWSQVGNYLVTYNATMVYVWDMETEVLFQRELEIGRPEIHPITNGWYIEESDGRDAPALFSVCSMELDDCFTQSFPSAIRTLIVPSGDMVLTQLWGQDNLVTVWTRQEDGTYLASTTFDPQESIEFAKVSPNGAYFFTSRIMIDLVTFELLQPPERRYIGAMAWLADSRHYVSLNDDPPPTSELSIYEVGNIMPLDTLDLEALFGRELINNWLQLSALGPSNIRTSPDGQYIIVGFGGASLLIPVDYQ